MVFEMTLATNLATNFNSIISYYGTKYILVHKSVIYDNYDQEVLTLAGTETGSCYFLPITEMKNGDDFQYLQEGLIREADYKLFMASGPTISGADFFVIGTGSYSVLRWYDYTTEGKVIYKKVFVRSM